MLILDYFGVLLPGEIILIFFLVIRKQWNFWLFEWGSKYFVIQRVSKDSRGSAWGGPKKLDTKTAIVRGSCCRLESRSKPARTRLASRSPMMNGSFSGYIPFPENTLFGILRQLNLDSPIYPRGITSNGAILTQAAVDVHTNYSNQVKNNYQIRAPSSLNPQDGSRYMLTHRKEYRRIRNSLVAGGSIISADRGVSLPVGNTK